MLQTITNNLILNSTLCHDNSHPEQDFLVKLSCLNEPAIFINEFFKITSLDVSYHSKLLCRNSFKQACHQFESEYSKKGVKASLFLKKIEDYL